MLSYFLLPMVTTMRKHNNFKNKGVAGHLVDEMNNYNLNTVKDWQNVIQFAQQMQLNINPDIPLPTYDNMVYLELNGYTEDVIIVKTYMPLLPNMFRRIALSAFHQACAAKFKGNVEHEQATRSADCPAIVHPTRFDDIAGEARELIIAKLNKAGIETAPLDPTTKVVFNSRAQHPEHSEHVLLIAEEGDFTCIHNIRMEGDNVVFDYV